MIVYHGTDSYSAQNIMEAGIDLARGEESVDNARYDSQQGIVSSNHNLDLVYDVVIDETADAGVGGLVSNFRYKETRGGIDLRTAINKVQRSNSSTWGRQMSFHTSRAVKMCIKSIRSVDV